MDTNELASPKLYQTLEDIKSIAPDGTEIWSARDLMPLLEYTEWRNFANVVGKAKIACEQSSQNVNDHFVDINKMITIGRGAQREQEDVLLDRYACYLIAQNADSSKETVALAQTYFLFFWIAVLCNQITGVPG